jgi:hypothetical protein
MEKSEGVCATKGIRKNKNPGSKRSRGEKNNAAKPPVAA